MAGALMCLCRQNNDEINTHKNWTCEIEKLESQKSIVSYSSGINPIVFSNSSASEYSSFGNEYSRKDSQSKNNSTLINLFETGTSPPYLSS